MPLITRRSIDARFAPRIGRQMRLDLRKLRFRQPKLVPTHLCLLFGSRESRHYVRANTFMGPDPRMISPELGLVHLDLLGLFLASVEKLLRVGRLTRCGLIDTRQFALLPFRLLGVMDGLELASIAKRKHPQLRVFE